MDIDVFKKRLNELLKEQPNLRLITHKHTGYITALSGLNWGKKQSDNAGLAFFSQYKELLSDTVDREDLKYVHKISDIHDGCCHIYGQVYKGIAVAGSGFRFYLDARGCLCNCINSLRSIDMADTKINCSKEQALELARQAVKRNDPTEREPELIIYNHKAKDYLAWHVPLRTDDSKEKKIYRYSVFIDANKAKVIHWFNTLKNDSVVGTGIGYYSGPCEVIAERITDTNYELRDTTRVAGGGPEIITYDTSFTYVAVDEDNNWDDVDSPWTNPRNNQTPLVDIHRYAAMVVDYYLLHYNHNSWDGAGETVKVVGNTKVENETGPLTDDGSYWDGAIAYFGNGSGEAPGFDYVTSLDVVAHELTHGYVERTTQLGLFGAANPLAEAFCDIFAAFICEDWRFGRSFWLADSAPCLRNLADPTNGGLWNKEDALNSSAAGHNPDHMEEIDENDTHPPHINSTIISHCLYLLTEGGPIGFPA